MDIAHYERFLACEARGLKHEAKQAVDAFVASFRNDGEIEAWVRAYLPQLRTNRHSRIRHELFERLIFPVLKRGLDANDVDAMLWLGRLIQNVYPIRALHTELDGVTDAALFRRCHALDPANDDARRLLLDAQIRWLAFCAHEWPGALLCGNQAADADDCRALRDEVRFLRGLGAAGDDAAFLDEFEVMLNDYERRLAGERQGGDGA